MIEKDFKEIKRVLDRAERIIKNEDLEKLNGKRLGAKIGLGKGHYINLNISINIEEIGNEL